MVFTVRHACHWERRENILFEPGRREDDQTMANHADVLVKGEHAYVFYFTYPEVSYQQRQDLDFRWEYRHRRSSLQIAELTIRGGELYCDRNEVTIDLEMESWTDAEF